MRDDAHSPRPLILIVDDNNDNINVIEEMLERHRFDYHALSDPTRIQEALDHQTPELILLDLYMPQRSGLDTLLAVKGDSRFESIPVIMLTAETDKTMLSRCLEAGAMDYLNKPVDPVELQARIRSALRLAALNRALAERNDELARKNREIQKFTGTIVHDLKNPLTVITACIDLVEKALVDAHQSSSVELAEMIREVALSMGTSIDTLLDVNQIQQGAFKLEMIRATPVPFVEKCLHRLRLIAQKKSIRLLHETADVPEVQYDEKGLSGILMNLVGNAIKYSQANTTVRVAYDVTDKNVKVSISDEGQGLSDKDIQMVFKEFQRLSSRPTGGESSTGLGLAIVKAIADAMGSSLGAESNGKGRGAKFWFTLPRN